MNPGFLSKPPRFTTKPPGCKPRRGEADHRLRLRWTTWSPSFLPSGHGSCGYLAHPTLGFRGAFSGAPSIFFVLEPPKVGGLHGHHPANLQLWGHSVTLVFVQHHIICLGSLNPDRSSQGTPRKIVDIPIPKGELSLTVQMSPRSPLGKQIDGIFVGSSKFGPQVPIPKRSLCLHDVWANPR